LFEDDSSGVGYGGDTEALESVRRAEARLRNDDLGGGDDDDWMVAHGPFADKSSSGGREIGGAAAEGGAGSGGGLWHAREEEGDTGNVYYWNDVTDEIRWEPPAWVEEVDQETGCAYYVKVSPTDLDGADADPAGFGATKGGSAAPFFASTWRLPPEGALARGTGDAAEESSSGHGGYLFRSGAAVAEEDEEDYEAFEGTGEVDGFESSRMSVGGEVEEGMKRKPSWARFWKKKA